MMRDGEQIDDGFDRRVDEFHREHEGDQNHDRDHVEAVQAQNQVATSTSAAMTKCTRMLACVRVAYMMPSKA